MPSPSKSLLEQARSARAVMRSDPTSARQLADDVVARSGPDDRLAHANALIVQAMLFQRETRYAEALRASGEALALARSLDDAALIARSLNLLGLGHHALADDRTAIQHFHEAVRLAEKAGDDELLTMASANTAMVMHADGDLESARRVYHTLVEENPHVRANPHLLAQMRHNLGQATWDLGRDLPECAKIFALAADGKRAAGDQWSLTLTLCSLSGVYRDLERFAEAREVLTEIESFLVDQSSHELRSLYHLNLGVWLQADKNPARDLDAAQTQLELSVAAGQEGKLPEYETRSREYLAEARIAAHRHAEAYAELKAANKIKADTHRQESQRRIERLRVVFEAERADTNAQHERRLREEAEAFNARIQEKNRQLESVNREKTDIIGLISHDLRAPLEAAVELTLDLIANPHDHDNVRDSGQALLSTQRQMLDLTQSLLDIEALESGSLKTPSNDQNLDALFAKLTASHRAAIRAKNLRIVRQLPDQTRAWHGPRVMLERAVENLLSNAIKYSPHGNPITLAAAWESPGLTIRISDSGPGVPLEKRTHMFEKFATLGTAPTGGESAHGLGLYLARCCAQHAGGDIHYEDTPGGGATFVLTLPQG